MRVLSLPIGVLCILGVLVLAAAAGAAPLPPGGPNVATIDPARPPRHGNLGGTPTGTPTGMPLPTATPTRVCTAGWAVSTSPNVGTASNTLAAVATAGPSDVWAVGRYDTGSLTQTLIERWAGAGWQVVASPNLPLSNHTLLGVAGSAATDAWAVGYSTTGTHADQTLILHWNGSAWSLVPSPNPGSGLNRLQAVTARAANDAWAVGVFYNNGSNVGQTLILHWNGSIWSAVASPSPGTAVSELTGVMALSGTDAWAVGGFQTNVGTTETLTLHWNGSVWSVVPSPNVVAASNVLMAVAAQAGNDVWAVGITLLGSTSRTLALHWDGTAWAVAPSPNTGGTANGLQAVTVIAANDVWAVGQGGSPSTGQTLTLHWDGAAWSLVPSANPAGANWVVGVAARSPTEVWAVGYRSTSPALDQTLIERYGNPCVPGSPSVTPFTPTPTPTRGAPTPTPTLAPGCGPAWSFVPNPDPGSLAKVAAGGPQDAWAVGAAALHWNGTAWASVPVPGNPLLKAVAADRPRDAWAVSDQDLYHWAGSQWTAAPVPTPVFGSCDHHYASVAAYAPNEVWIVGSSIACSPYIVHYMGGTWAVVGPAPGAAGPSGGVAFDLYDVWADGPGTAWAVGSSLCGACNGTYILRLTPGGVIETHAPAVGPLSAVVGFSASDAWAGSASGTLLHWDGSAWTVVPAPAAGAITDLSASGPNDVWAMGQSAILHWDGTSWGVSPAPTGGGSGIAQTGPQDVWAVAGTTLEHWPDLPLFRDVLGDHSFYPYVQTLACRGLISGYPCGGGGEPCPGLYYRPGNNVTRGQTAKIVSASAGFSDSVPSTQQTFEDVPNSGSFWLWVERLSTRGIIGGYPCGGPDEPCVSPTHRPYFRPGNNVTRGQLSKIVAGAAGWTEIPTGQTFEDVPPGSTFYLYIQRSASREIISGYPCGGVGEPCLAPDNRPYFRPFNNATRGQMAKIAASAFFPNSQTPAH